MISWKDIRLAVAAGLLGAAIALSVTDHQPDGELLGVFVVLFVGMTTRVSQKKE